MAKLYAISQSEGTIELHLKKPKKRRTMDIDKTWRVYYAAEGEPILYCDGGHNRDLYYFLANIVRRVRIPYVIDMSGKALDNVNKK